MKRIILPFVILFSALFIMVSCLNTDDVTDVVYYRDTAITSFTLGTLNRTVWTTSSKGEDSSYVAEITGSNYKFYIDQTKREIYNPDSLPKGTDIAHVLVTVTSKNGGIVVIKDTDSDSISYVRSTDSIDFTQPREFQVYSYDGMVHRTYKVSVNAHKEEPDSFNWRNTGTYQDFRTLTGMKAVTTGGRLLVFGCDGSSTAVYSSPLDGNTSWTKVNTGITLDAEAYKSIIVKDGQLYTLNGGQVVTSADAATWQTVGTAQLTRLLGASRGKMYAIDTDGRMAMSEDNGTTWTADNINGDADMLPTENMTAACLPLETDDNAEYIIICGNRNLTAHPEDSVAMVWNKIEEYSTDSEQHSWTNCNDNNGYRLPRLSSLSMTAYNNVLLAIGGRGQGTSTATAFSHIYVSEDKGLTWHEKGMYYLPDDNDSDDNETFTNGGSDVCAMTADGDNFLWIICGGTGEVWRGRLNRLGWTEQQTSFTE